MSDNNYNDWILVRLEGTTFLGLPKSDPTGMLALSGGLALEPVFEFVDMVIPAPKGFANAQYLKGPLGLQSVVSMVLPRAGISIRLGDLAEADRKRLTDLITQHMTNLRAAASNIVMPNGITP